METVVSTSSQPEKLKERGILLSGILHNKLLPCSEVQSFEDYFLFVNLCVLLIFLSRVFIFKKKIIQDYTVIVFTKALLLV